MTAIEIPENDDVFAVTVRRDSAPGHVAVRTHTSMFPCTVFVDGQRLADALAALGYLGCPPLTPGDRYVDSDGEQEWGVTFTRITDSAK